MIPARQILVAVLTSALLMPCAYAASPREDLKAVVAQINAKPADRALRMKAIALAGKLKPAPAVPPEAERAFVMAGTYQQEAKQPSDFALAIDAFQDALKAAPWWGDAYYNLSVSLESAGRFDEAKDALELYLLTKPKDAKSAQHRLYALDAKKNIAAKQAAEIEQRKQNLEGRWEQTNAHVGTHDFTIRKDGDRLTLKAGKLFSRDGLWQAEDVTIQGRNVRLAAVQPACPNCLCHFDLTLSSDGTALEGTIIYSHDNSTAASIFKRVASGE